MSFVHIRPPVTCDAEGARGHPAAPVTHVLGNPDVRVHYLQRAGFHIASCMRREKDGRKVSDDRTVLLDFLPTVREPCGFSL